VHSGSARAGHYYSFIKSFEDGKWYRFDDCDIFQASFEDLYITYGDNSKHSISATTGYILMYRQVNKNGKPPVVNIEDELINSSLLEVIKEENIRILEEEEKLKERLNTLQIKFIYEDRVVNIQEKKYNTVNTLKQKVMKEFNINTDVSNVRIRNVNHHTHKLQEAYQVEEKVKFVNL
jgi:hypothetical protein